MNDNLNHLGSNWGSGTPRTMDEAFPRRSRDTWNDGPSLWSQIKDVLMLVGAVAVFGIMAYVGPMFF